MLIEKKKFMSWQLIKKKKNGHLGKFSLTCDLTSLENKNNQGAIDDTILRGVLFKGNPQNHSDSLRTSPIDKKLTNLDELNYGEYMSRPMEQLQTARRKVASTT